MSVGEVVISKKANCTFKKKREIAKKGKVN
jgi:hypothetical protein